MKLIAIAKYRNLKIQKDCRYYEFSFKGVYLGQRVKSLWVSSSIDIELTRSSTYVMGLNFLTTKDELLIGELVDIISVERFNFEDEKSFLNNFLAR